MQNSPNDPPPPTLPPRPGGRGAKPVPFVPPSNLQEPDAVYDDCNESNGLPSKPDDLYDDFDEKSHPPPLPPHPELPEATYDDVGGDLHAPPPLPPQRPQPALPPMAPPQDTYDDVDPGGPIVQQLPKRSLPPAPVPDPPSLPSKIQEASSVYELDDDNEEVKRQPPLPPPPPPMQDPQGIYEVDPEPSPGAQAAPPSAPAPPPLLPPKTPTHLPPQPAKSGSPSPKVKSPPHGGFAIMNLGLLQNAKAGLRRVSVDDTATPAAVVAVNSDSRHDPKEYGSCPDTVYDAKKIFQNKAEGGKPSIPKQRSVEKVISKPPNPPAPLPQKPVNKVEPLEAPEDIYDDASSVVIEPPDPLAKYDWYHGKIERKEGERRVQALVKDGTFLVRISEKDPAFPFTLVVLHKGQVNNLQIRKRSDGKVALGKEKTGEVAFKDVPVMIDHHRQHPVVLLGNNQSQVKLQLTPPKS